MEKPDIPDVNVRLSDTASPILPLLECSRTKDVQQLAEYHFPPLRLPIPPEEEMTSKSGSQAPQDASVATEGTSEGEA